MTPQLITKLPAYEMGECKIHLRRPGTIARLELEEATPGMTALIRALVSGAPDDEVSVTARDMTALHEWLSAQITLVTSIDGAPVHMPDGWLDSAGPAVALGLLHHIMVFASMADRGVDPDEALRAAEAAIKAASEEE